MPMTMSTPLARSQDVPPAPVGEPLSRTEIVETFRNVREWGSRFWNGIAAEMFFVSRDGAWSPADHVRHLIKSNRPVAGALTMPKALLLIRFGIAFRPSRSYSGLRDVYREALDGGLKAGGFSPRPLATDEQTFAERDKILTSWACTLGTLAEATTNWSDRSLDRLRLPHPGLGLLTVREMLFFTLYHNTHHVHGAASRLAERT
jgi:hypothetical protein